MTCRVAAELKIFFQRSRTIEIVGQKPKGGNNKNTKKRVKQVTPATLRIHVIEDFKKIDGKAEIPISQSGTLLSISLKL